MAKIIKISELPKAKKISFRMQKTKEKLLNAPNMSKAQLKEYEEIDKWMRGWKI